MSERAVRATAVARAAEAASEAFGDEVLLDFDARHRRRFLLTTTSGRDLLLDLAEVPGLDEGDHLLLEDGGRVRVRCADEALLEVVPASPGDLPRLAWHLGNRHLPTELAAHALWIGADHVIEDMLRRLGAEVRAVQRPFRPEGGAYGHGRTHGHDHGHSHGGADGHGHDGHEPHGQDHHHEH